MTYFRRTMDFGWRSRMQSLGGPTAIFIAALIAIFAAGSASAGTKRTISMAAVEFKGSAHIGKEPFPSMAPPNSEGYRLVPPDAAGQWQVSTYRWEPTQIVVNRGDEVTLQIFGVNGLEHPAFIDGYRIVFKVRRGQLTTVTFTADKAGVFPIRCSTHDPSMTAELIVLPAR
jgi:plastocyanin